jgi:hypothetical protein
MITRRALGVMTVTAVAVRNMAARSEGQAFVSGWGLPGNLDPHRIFDVPMQTVMPNA